MSWIKIDDNAMDHPKILALTDGAFRLWMRGLAYCRRHLTDGLISHLALKTFREAKPQRVEELTTPPSKGVAPLWETRDEGYQVHDYLAWNDSREHVESAREQAKERMSRLRGSSRGVRANRERTSREVRDTNPTQYQPNPIPAEREHSRALDSPMVVEDKEALSVRAGNFAEWYRETHGRIIGVAYMGNPNNDYPAAMRLVAAFADQQLQDAALVWFGMDDDFATNGTRTIPKFASRATKCVELARRVAS